jgi:hypothetical protein
MNENPFDLLPDLGGGAIAFTIIYILIIIASYWKLFQKANRPGWAAIVPIYNAIVYLQVAGLSPWFVLLGLAAIVPVLGTLLILIFLIYLSIKVAAAFGKGVLFGIGIAFLPVIFVAILAFGDAKYQPVKENTSAEEA